MRHIEGKIRLVTGVVLALYVIQHLINHAFGIISFEAAEVFRLTVATPFQTLPGQIALYGSFLFHGLIAFKTLFMKASLRMPFWQWMQLAFGLMILPLLIGHVLATRGLHLFGDVEPDYYFEIAAILFEPWRIVLLAVLMLIVWMHMTIGLHYWLRLKSGYRKFIQYFYALAVLIPALALVGVFAMIKDALVWIDDSDRLAEVFASVRAMDPSTLQSVRYFETQAIVGLVVVLVLVLLARRLRLWLQLRKGTYMIAHSGGHEVRAQIGWSLLEALRQARIPHASVCGGRGRCTTCRVRIGPGLEHLEPPQELESQALDRISASGDIRLACQIRPRSNISITPLVLAQQSVAGAMHAGGVQGHEEHVVAMFVDMRGSTAMGERALAYDVVFILNRFFTELSLALDETRGHYAQFAGDGLMALYGIGAQNKESACADALRGAKAMFGRLARLNAQLQEEFGESIRMGIGIHGGDAIVGTMGPPTTPLLTAIGDNINIAARLEAQTKIHDCDVIVSAETLTRSGIDHAFCRTADLEVRGRRERVSVCLINQDELPRLAGS